MVESVSSNVCEISSDIGHDADRAELSVIVGNINLVALRRLGTHASYTGIEWRISALLSCFEA
ncbi:hypothetical protein GCM10007385_39790 [Tateyamaria omphalii]|nr:hypothetical protein GCM10007385_39790 [Tateyamaria omphalii]